MLSELEERRNEDRKVLLALVDEERDPSLPGLGNSVITGLLVLDMLLIASLSLPASLSSESSSSKGNESKALLRLSQDAFEKKVRLSEGMNLYQNTKPTGKGKGKRCK